MKKVSKLVLKFLSVCFSFLTVVSNYAFAVSGEKHIEIKNNKISAEKFHSFLKYAGAFVAGGTCVAAAGGIGLCIKSKSKNKNLDDFLVRDRCFDSLEYKLSIKGIVEDVKGFLKLMTGKRMDNAKNKDICYRFLTDINKRIIWDNLKTFVLSDGHLFAGNGVEFEFCEQYIKSELCATFHKIFDGDIVVKPGGLENCTAILEEIRDLIEYK